MSNPIPVMLQVVRTISLYKIVVQGYRAKLTTDKQSNDSTGVLAMKVNKLVIQKTLK